MQLCKNIEALAKLYGDEALSTAQIKGSCAGFFCTITVQHAVVEGGLPKQTQKNKFMELFWSISFSYNAWW